MGRRFRMICIFLVLALTLQTLPLSAAADEQDTPLFADDFGGGLGSWDLFGSTAWQIQGSGTAAKLTGTTTATAPQRAVVKSSSLPYSSADYVMAFDAQGDRFRALFRYSSGTSYYFLEFKSGHMVELWKYPNSSTSVQVGSAVDIAAALPGFDLANRHDYRLTVEGSRFALEIDGAAVTAFTDASLQSGGVGFALKSVGPAASLSVDRLEVLPPPVPEGGSFAIVHTPVAQIPYNADLPIAFSVTGAGPGTSAVIHYGYGDDAPDRTLEAASGSGGTYSGTIPGTNRASSIRYYLTAEDGAGQTARYPETGELTAAIQAIEPYANDFDGETPNAAPAGWTTGGSAKVAQLPDGNRVLNLNGSGSAKLDLPMYRNADNFVVRFKVKYERTSTAAQNTWRLRYRATDDNNNNALEWATHNSKYFIMRKTTVGGNYPVANYVQSLLGDWHDYELRINGITHELYIDGEKVASGQDSDALAPVKGYFQWNVVGGINLMIDDFSIEPIPLPYVIDLQPSGNYSGIYTPAETPGLNLSLDAGAAAHDFRIDYTVSRADGDKATIATGSKTYSLEAYGKTEDILPFVPQVSGIGTYDVKADFALDGKAEPGLSKQLRIAVVGQEGTVGAPDLDNESKFGLNTHYALNWKDDIIDGARKLGAQAHRSGINWPDVDKNAKDASGNTVYDYAGTDTFLNKLSSYGFNQITVLGINQNPSYQTGTVNTAPALKAMGDFVYRTVYRYKGQIRQWEMPNEPEIFSQPYIPEEYVQMQKVAYLNMKKADPNAMLLAGDHSSSVLSVLPRELALGSYDFADAYSFHPYVYNSMPDDNLPSLIDRVKDLVNAYGGWKDYYLTEGGWPTATAGYPSVSEEIQRDYIVRAFLTDLTLDQVKAYEYYDYKNDGTDDRNYDIFWGITDNDGRPKLAYAAVNQLMTSLKRARYLGTWDAGDSNVSLQLFLEDGQPVMAAWKKADHKDDPAVKPPTSEVTLPFGTNGVTAKDVNGVPFAPEETADGDISLTVSGSPVYLTGLPAGFVDRAAAQLLASKRQEAAGKLEALRTETNGALVDGDLRALNALAVSLAPGADGTLSSAELERGIKGIYALMTQAAGQIGDGSLASAPGYVALEALYNLAETASVALAYTLNGAAANALDYAFAAHAATAAYEARKGEAAVMPVSSAAVLRMNRYGRLAEAAYARGDYADSYAYNLLAREFAGAAEAIVASESPVFVGVMANLTPTQTSGEAGYDNAFTLSLTNDTDVSREATVTTRLPDGWAAVQTSPQSAELTVPAFGSASATLQVTVPEDAAKGRYEIAFDVTEDGNVIDTKTAQLTVEDGIGVRFVPVKQTLSDLNVLTVELDGTSSAPKTGTVTLIGPDEVPLAPVTTNSFSGLRKGDTLRLDFVWTDRDPAPFNEYPVDVRVEDTESGRTIFRDAAMPVEFNLIQKAYGVTIDGDLSDWQDAYPFHLRSSAQNASGYHDPDNLEATAYAKWDEDGLDVAVSVRDDIHKQSEDAANLWKNDSVQVSLDPLNNREAPYGPDDVEWGFALTDTGQLLANVFSSSPPNPNGDISGRTPFAAVRDETAKRTVYEFKIPTAYVQRLQPAPGGFIGLNVAVNDADLQNGRDDFIQWTKGTADSKNTSLYDSFEFIDVRPPVSVEGVSVTPESVLLRPDGEAALTARVTPENASDASLFWTVGNPAVANVSEDGHVHAHGDGTTSVVATTYDGGYQATVTVMVDGTAPNLRIRAPASLSLLDSATLALDAEDALSGVANASLQLDGQPIASGYAVTPLSLMPGEHRLSAEATDAAGNRATAEATFAIAFGWADLDDLLSYAISQGWIADNGFAQSLLAKIQHLQRQAQTGEAGPNVAPLAQEIAAQSSKKIDKTFASVLQQLLDYLQQQLQGD